MLSSKARSEIMRQIRLILIRNGKIQSRSRIKYLSRKQRGIYVVQTVAGALTVDLLTQTWS